MTESALGSAERPADGQISGPTAPGVGRAVHEATTVNTDGAARSVPRDAPWTNSRFWLIQFVILALYLGRLAATVAFHLDPDSLVLELSTFAIFLGPVIYASLNYGTGGALFTSGWVSLLAVPRFISDLSAHSYSAAWLEAVAILLLNALALIVGQRITRERNARRLAERAAQVHLNAEALYRDLFDSNQAPILIVDGSGNVVEANASAQRAFATSTSSSVGDRRQMPDATTRLVDMIGPEGAGHVLTRLVSGQIFDPATERDQSPELDRVEPVAFEIDGQPALLRPTATMLNPSPDGIRMQVVFEDVTAETRRHDLMEAYAARVVLGQEEERRHIAQELHDGPLQALIHLCRLIDAASSETGSKPDTSPFSDLRATVEDIVAELRSIARGLRPSILDDLGLVASINQMLSEAGERQHLVTSFGVTGSEHRLARTVELALFRIAQEAISNVERHAAAHTVAVGLNFEERGLRLLIKDDGVGFSAGIGRQPEGSASLGLPGMTERAHLIGSRLQIHSQPGSGTTVDVWVPARVLEQN
jgi:signal transduction histidine kinase